MTESYLSDIADAIREKLDVETEYKPGQMAAAIASIPTGTTPTGTISITQNGTVDVTNYASANVNVSGGGSGGGMYGITLSGGYNGGAALSVIVDAVTVFSAVGNSPYNDTYTPSSGSFSVGNDTWTIQVTTSQQGLYVYIVFTNTTSAESMTFTATAKGSNGSYGFDYSAWGLINQSE